jgi:hypothetical protein
MTNPCRPAAALALIVCFAVSEWPAAVLASGDPAAGSNPAPAASSDVQSTSATAAMLPSAPGPAPSIFTVTDRHLAAIEFNASAQRGWFRRERRHERRAAATAIILGAAASITGTALLVYANRPACDTNPSAGGCGYGAKVVGGSVLSAGVVGLVVGALMWP